jgi:hypothetical protein
MDDHHHETPRCGRPRADGEACRAALNGTFAVACRAHETAEEAARREGYLDGFGLGWDACDMAWRRWLGDAVRRSIAQLS